MLLASQRGVEVDCVSVFRGEMCGGGRAGGVSVLKTADEDIGGR